MLHLVDAALEDAVNTSGPNPRIGLLATDATLASGLYINRTPAMSSAGSVQWVLPTAHEVIAWVMPGIAAVKAGNLQQGRELLLLAAQALQRRGANCLILGCTEIPLVLDSSNAPLPVVDATAALARRAVAWSMAQRSLGV
jgi:aspartate racemase